MESGRNRKEKEQVEDYLMTVTKGTQRREIKMNKQKQYDNDRKQR